MQQRYGTTQVCEYTLTQAEVDRIIAENIAKRCDPSYDFDTNNPLVLKVQVDNQPPGVFHYIVRFVQRAVTQDGKTRDHPNFRPLPDLKKQLPGKAG